MRYAVPMSGGQVATHFGHCEQFALFDVDEARNEIVVWLAEEGVSAVIASGMGSRAQELFRQNRIKIIVNVFGSDPEKVVLDHIRGTLEVGDDVCDH